MEYTVSYNVGMYYDVTVERPADMSPKEIIESITRDEVASGNLEGGWDEVKEAWRNDTVSLIYDQDGNQVY